MLVFSFSNIEINAEITEYSVYLPCFPRLMSVLPLFDDPGLP
jgi:hypothetical protein